MQYQNSTKGKRLPKRVVAVLICLSLLLGGIALAENTFSAEANPVILTTSEDLNNFRASLSSNDYAGKTVQLGGNIVYTGGDTGGSQLSFQGAFDGQGFSITGFSDNSSGLFQSIGSQGKVGRLHINMNVSGITAPVYGAIANTCQGEVSQCWVSGLMRGGASAGTVAVGGLVGQLQDDEANPGCQINNSIMEATIQPQEGGATLTAYGAASTTDNQRVYAVLVLGELDGDTVYGLSDKGAARAGGLPAYYDNTMTSASYEDQYSVGKTYDELCDMSLYTSAGFDQNTWVLRTGDLPTLTAFNNAGAYEEEEEDTAATESTGSSSSSSSSQTISVKSVALSSSALNLTVGETATLKYTLSPSNATNRRVSWSSSNTSVASVSSTGVVTALAEGTTNITITTNSKGRTAVCQVTVSAGVNRITLSANSLSGSAGSILSLSAILDSSVASSAVTWTTSDSSIVALSAGPTALSQNLSLLKAGTCYVTATVSGTSYAAVCQVTVASSVSVQSVSLNQISLSLTVGNSAQLVATVLPDTATNRNVTWSTGDASIATVSGGTVTGVAPGTTAIVVTTQEGSFTTACQVTVTAASSGGNDSGGDNTGGDNTGGDNTGGDTTGGDNTGA